MLLAWNSDQLRYSWPWPNGQSSAVRAQKIFLTQPALSRHQKHWRTKLANAC